MTEKLRTWLFAASTLFVSSSRGSASSASMAFVSQDAKLEDLVKTAGAAQVTSYLSEAISHIEEGLKFDISDRHSTFSIDEKGTRSSLVN